MVGREACGWGGGYFVLGGSHELSLECVAVQGPHYLYSITKE